MKRKFGQAALAVIDHALSEYGLLEEPVAAEKRGSTYTPEAKKLITQYRAELRAYRAAFKKMAGATLHNEDGNSTCIEWTSNKELAKAILKARAVEAKRK